VPRTCTICEHPERADIDRALSGGWPIARTAATFGISPDALKRHKANHVLPEMRGKLAGDPDLKDFEPLAEMKNLYARISGFLDKAEAADSWPAVVKFHAEARKDLELLAKLSGELDERPQVNILISPHVQQVIIDALHPYPEARQAVADNLASLEAAS